MQDVWKVHGEAELVEVQHEVQEDHGEVQDLQP